MALIHLVMQTLGRIAIIEHQGLDKIIQGVAIYGTKLVTNDAIL
jgi:hypothetical protein